MITTPARSREHRRPEGLCDEIAVQRGFGNAEIRRLFAARTSFGLDRLVAFF